MSNELLEALSSGNAAWGRPNDRTAYVDAALVRVCRAFDATANAVVGFGRRPKSRTVEVESISGSLLRAHFSAEGHWRFELGMWTDAGLVHRSTLLRPALRGVARATRPTHAEALSILVTDVDLICAQIISDLGGKPLGQASEQVDISTMIEGAFGLSAADVSTLLRVGTIHEIGVGATVMSEGDPGQFVAFVVDGVVEVDLADRIVLLKAGSVVGETAVVNRSIRSATVRAVTEATLVVVPENEVNMFPAGLRDALSRKVEA
jgi:Cyclic nucleotide-binding domain